MLRLKRIEKYCDLDLLPESGYVSDIRYKVDYKDEEDRTKFILTRQTNQKPFVKKWIRTDDDKDRLIEIIDQELSFTLFKDDFPVGHFLLERRDWNNSLYIESIEVIRKERGKGLGTYLMKEIDKIAREKGFRLISLETQTSNGTAIDFYKKNGYRIEGIDISFYTNDDLEKHEMAVFMKKRIF